MPLGDTQKAWSFSRRDSEQTHKHSAISADAAQASTVRKKAFFSSHFFHISPSSQVTSPSHHNSLVNSKKTLTQISIFLAVHAHMAIYYRDVRTSYIM